MGSAENAQARSRRVLNVLDLVLELDPALRGAYLETLGRGDAELKLQVLAVLRLLGGAQAEPEGDATRAEARLASLEMPERVGPYQVVREIGRGGMSRVYLAERADQEFERQVALKVIEQGLEAPIVHQRFLAERQILASFDCPQIAKLFDGGTLPNGRPYLVMELVDGVRADQFCDENRLPLDERLVLFRKICGAVSYAHQQLVVHRDLKPSNILVTPDKEPKLLDFGIAKLLDPESFPLEINEATRSQFRPMTPTYASPEQLLGEPITTATDIYALGVLLYQLLTGEVPHSGQDRLQQVLRERAGDEKITKPSERLESVAAENTWQGQDRKRIARQLRGDLDNIVAKALRPQAADRYASVVDLDEDLRRYLEGEPVRATRETPTYLLGKFLRRYRLPVAVAATILLLVAGFAAFSQRQAQRIAEERDRANEERDRANEIRGFLASLIGTADSQSRRSGTVSLKELLDENLERLQKQPFKDPRTQFEMLELIGDGHASLGIFHRAAEIYEMALTEVKGTEFECNGILVKLARASTDSGLFEASSAALRRTQVCPNTAPIEVMILASSAAKYHLTFGELKASANRLNLGLNSYSSQSTADEALQDLMILRLNLRHYTGIVPGEKPTEFFDSLAILTSTNSKQFSFWEPVHRLMAYQDPPEQTQAALLYSFQLTKSHHGLALAKLLAADLLTDCLVKLTRFSEASRINTIAILTAEKLLDLDTKSVRHRYQLAQTKVSQGEILQALGQDQSGDQALREAIADLEPMARDTNIIFPKVTLARAYLLAGRIDEARPLVRHLLELGWRRPDFFELAKAKGALPDPLPPPLELDLSLPPKLRAYIDSLPKVPPPWETATDLPTVEEILLAEEARLGITPPVH